MEPLLNVFRPVAPLADIGKRHPDGGEKDGLYISDDRIAGAPVEVRRWLRSLDVPDALPEDDFILDHNGEVSTGEGLAVCRPAEIKSLIRVLSKNYQALQVLFELGCDYRNPETGERRAYILKTKDFLRHTGIRDSIRLFRCIHDINNALRTLRADQDAVLCRISGRDRFVVHKTTQYVIYRFARWLAHMEEDAAGIRSAPDAQYRRARHG